jgi:oligoendopeptidase F
MKKGSSDESKDVWNLNEILKGKSVDNWIKEVNSMVEQFKKYRNALSNSITSQKLLEIVRQYESINICFLRIESYYSLKFYENTKDSDALAKLGFLKQMGAEISNQMLFFNLWFMHLDDKIAAKHLQSKELRPYRYHLESIRRAKPYTKTEEIEQLLHIKDITGLNAYADLYNIITNGFTFRWDGKDASKEEVVAYFTDENPRFRQQAYDTVLTKYKDNSTVLSEIYKNIVLDWVNDGIKIRNHKSSIAVRNLSYDVTDKSVNALLSTVKKNVGLFQEYFKYKYKLNQKKTKYPYSRYNLYAPFIIKAKKRYNYEDSKALVFDTYRKFDQRFFDRAKKIFDAKHVHSHPQANKRSGAFCYSITKDMEPYLLLNHTDKIRDVFTMIHELGHGIHDIFAGENQTDLERHASLCVCETASVFSEMVLADRLLKESDDKGEKTQILVQLLDNQWATIVRQAYFVMFEQYAHEQIPKGITSEKLNEYYYGLLKEQFGDMDIPKVFVHEWNYIPHMHETPFYCYAYAWGNLFVIALYDMYRKEGKPFIEKYVKLLSAGGSRSPTDLMKELGANPEDEKFWQRGFNIIREELEELKRLGRT